MLNHAKQGMSKSHKKKQWNFTAVTHSLWPKTRTLAASSSMIKLLPWAFVSLNWFCDWSSYFATSNFQSLEQEWVSQEKTVPNWATSLGYCNVAYWLASSFWSKLCYWMFQQLCKLETHREKCAQSNNVKLDTQNCAQSNSDRSNEAFLVLRWKHCNTFKTQWRISSQCL